ncbi:hypothetical protein BH11ARM2_BH11ARM2_15910 [soil metagenome]
MYPSAEFRPLIRFGYFMAFLAALRLVVGFLPVPLKLLPVATIIISIVFVVAPIAALFAAATYRWDRRAAIYTIVIGATTQFLARNQALNPHLEPLTTGVYTALAQTGLIGWCLGLGALLVTALKDKNMILPIAIFLGLFDIWLVFVPEGIAGQVARTNQAPLKALAYQVPKPAVEVQGGFAQPMLYIGPADFLFMAMFFVALYRFKMRTRKTGIAMAPTMAAYLLTVLIFHDTSIGPIRLGALPALVPIGLVVLGVNWKEFDMTKDEKQTTVAIFVIGVVLLAWRFWANRGAM